MSYTWWKIWTVAVGCALLVGTAAKGNDKPAVDESAIKAFVAYLAKNEIQLQPDQGPWWVVTDPKGAGYQVVIAIKTFPAGTSEEAMQATLKTINLAHMLNTSSRLAMSLPGLRRTDPATPLPTLDQVPVAVKLTKLFKDYRPPEPKK